MTNHKITINEEIFLALHYGIWPEKKEDRKFLYEEICKDVDYFTGNSIEYRNKVKQDILLKANL